MKPTYKHLLEFITLIICGIASVSLFNILYDNPMKIKGVPAYIGLSCSIIFFSLIIPGLIWSIRKIQKKGQNFIHFINTAWVMLVLIICFEFLYASKCEFGANAIISLLPVLLGLFVWFYIRRQKFLFLSQPSINDDSPATKDSQNTYSNDNACNCEIVAKADFNLAAKIFLAYFIIKQISGIIGAVSNFRVNDYLGGITGCYLATILVNSALIISAVFAFKPRKYALIGLITFLLIKTLAIFPYGNGHASGMAFGRNVGYLIVDFAPFAIAMCFKKNGVSGWRAFFQNSISKSSIIPKQGHNQLETTSTPIVEANVQEEELPAFNQNRKRANFHSISINIDWEKWKLPCFFITAIAAILVAVILIAKSNNKIEYFYIKDSMAHLSRHCESGTIYVTADAIFNNPNWMFCSKCISNRKMKQIEDSLSLYKFNSSEYAYTKNIDIVYKKLRQDYRDIGENAAEFSQMLLKQHNREVLLKINKTEGLGEWGDNLVELESFLYGGYDMFILNEEVRYIPHEEIGKFKSLCKNATPYILEKDLDNVDAD